MRKLLISQAVGSYFDLARVIDSLTLEEVIKVLSIEASSQRRKSSMCRLLKRAVRLNEIAFKEKLIREYLDGKKSICDNG